MPKSKQTEPNWGFGPQSQQQPQLQGNEPDGEEEGEEDGETLASLREQLAQLRGQLEGLQQRDEDRMSALLAAAQPQHQPAVEPEDDGELPDPATHPKEFQKAVSERAARTARKLIEQDTAQRAAEEDNARLMNDLWAGFQNAHPDLAEFQDLIQLEVQELRRSLQARKLDPVRAMATNKAGTIAQVAKGVAARLARYRQVAEQEGDEEGAERSQGDPFAFMNVPNQRTATIPGGNTKGKGKSKKGGKSEDDKPVPMVKQIMDLQRATGFF